ncbi:hypothetical protein CPC08DRAFT_268936 [Agrocybe pediades]|nr:hypothetical protein CPC08DRAFT_268936 [Agrocybe pediades]
MHREVIALKEVVSSNEKVGTVGLGIRGVVPSNSNHIDIFLFISLDTSPTAVSNSTSPASVSEFSNSTSASPQPIQPFLIICLLSVTDDRISFDNVPYPQAQPFTAVWFSAVFRLVGVSSRFIIRLRRRQ